MAFCALSLALESAGNSKEARIAMMAMTTSSSMRVKACHRARQRLGLRQSSGALVMGAGRAKAPEDWRSPKPCGLVDRSTLFIFFSPLLFRLPRFPRRSAHAAVRHLLQA